MVGKTGSGSGRSVGKTGRLGPGRSHDCTLLEFEDAFSVSQMLQWWDFLIVSLQV